MAHSSADITAFEIKYETDSSIPAPYAHFYHIKAHIDAQGLLHLDYQLHYLDRQDLSEEDITGEGFTMDDDVHWQGSLPAVWTETVQALIRQTTLRKRPEEADAYFEVVLVEATGKSQAGEPTNRAAWEYTAQELIQAIYETAGRERPLQLQFRKINADQTSLTLSLTLHFSTRQVEVSQTASARPPVQRTVPWTQAQALLPIVYMPDYYPENAQTKEPKKPGPFLDTGDGLWYEWGVSARNPSPKRDVLTEIATWFEKLVQG